MLYDAQKAMKRTNQTVEGAFIREMLASRVRQLKLNVDKHMIETGLAFESNFMFRTQRKMDSTLGPVFETVANTPLASSMEHTDSAFWHGFMKKLVNGYCPVRWPCAWDLWVLRKPLTCVCLYCICRTRPPSATNPHYSTSQ